MPESHPQPPESRADMVRLHVREQDDRTEVWCAWPAYAEPDAVEEVHVSIGDAEVTVERRRTPSGGTPTPWATMHRADASDLTGKMPLPAPPALRLTAALMIALGERALDAHARP